jgi:acyl-CoA hydrolase
MKTFSNPQTIAQHIIEQTHGKISLALPLGLGKANTIVNALVQAALDDPTIQLTIFTALSLERPQPTSELESRLMTPALDRLFGRYPPLQYTDMLHRGTLPPNIHVSEFFLLAGNWLRNDDVQRSYIAANYSDAQEYLVARKPNVIAQLLARDEQGNLSLSCNPDLTTDLFDLRREGKMDFIFAGEINSALPFMSGPSTHATGEVDLLLDNTETDFELFSVPKKPISLSQHATGLHISALVRDGGTLQIGIGSIGDAAAHALILRHQNNLCYRQILAQSPFVGHEEFKQQDTFEQGLYVVTEMLVDGLLRLFLAGVVKRQVDGAAIHAGFFLDSRSFYQTLREMNDSERAQIQMMPVSFTNTLYSNDLPHGATCGDESAKRRARVDARFVNNAMMATLMGAVISDGLDNGQVISGVGGQFDFVSQAFGLPGARSIITLNATRQHQGKTVSNIVWNYAHTTIPRPFKDIVVTEYGVADLRGKSDADTIATMLSITDSRFQDELLQQAKSAGKIADDYRIPDSQRHNTPATIARWLTPYRQNQTLPDFPFGTDFTDTEQRLLPALATLKNMQSSKRQLAKLFWQGMRSQPDGLTQECLQRMGLDAPRSWQERLYAGLLQGAIKLSRSAGSETAE